MWPKWKTPTLWRGRRMGGACWRRGRPSNSRPGQNFMATLWHVTTSRSLSPHPHLYSRNILIAEGHERRCAFCQQCQRGDPCSLSRPTGVGLSWPEWSRLQHQVTSHLTPHTGLCLENNNLTLQLPVWGSTTTRDCDVVHKGRLRDGDTSESHRTKSDPALRSSSSPTGRQSFSFWRNIHFLDCRFQNLFGKHLWPF